MHDTPRALGKGGREPPEKRGERDRKAGKYG